MALSEIEIKRCEKAVDAFMAKRRPPAHIRNQVDFGYRIVGQSVELFEIRPDWRDETQKFETPIAKATYVKTQKIWKIYWQRADMKWHLYEPEPQAKTIDQFLAVVGEDKYHCFFG